MSAPHPILIETVPKETQAHTPERDVMCLCRKCADYYFQSSHHYITREDPADPVYDECTICRSTHGHDYIIYRY